MSGIWHEEAFSSSDESEHKQDGEGKFVRAPTYHPGNKGKKNDVNAHGRCNKKTKAEWLSGSWPLKHFDGLLPPNERKAEWIRFRDQFERIASCKAPIEQRTQLTAMKIFAGDYLLNVIEMHEKLVKVDERNVYEVTIHGINKFFEQTCDVTKERMKFREMYMKPSEPFTDWLLRLEFQAKFCDFGVQQREEEFIQALLRRSAPSIAGKLYEMSDLFGNNLERIISHGKHLDYIKTEADESTKATQSKVNDSAPEEGTSDGLVVKPVNAVHTRPGVYNLSRFEPYRSSRPPSIGAKSQISQEWRTRVSGPRLNCPNCGKTHGLRECKAFRAKYFTCGKIGHFADVCRSFFRDMNMRRNIQNRPGQREGRSPVNVKDEVSSEIERINQVDDKTVE